MTDKSLLHQAFDDYKADYFVMQHGDRIGYITIAGGRSIYRLHLRRHSWNGVSWRPCGHEYVITDDLVRALVAFRAWLIRVGTSVLVMLWGQSYRPQHLVNVIGQEHITKRLDFMVAELHRLGNDGGFPHLMFAGSAGTGRLPSLWLCSRRCLVMIGMQTSLRWMRAMNEASGVYAPKSRSLLVVVLLEHISITKGRRFRFRSMLSSLTNATT